MGALSRSLLLFSLLAACAEGWALSATVLDIRDDGRLIVAINDIPVVVALGHVALPDDAGQRAATIARIRELATGKQGQLVWKADFGTADDGAGQVHLRLGTRQLVNSILIEEGLARFAPSGDPQAPHARLFAMVEKKAKDERLGIWAEGATVIAQADPPAQPAAGSAATRTRAESFPFCAELNSRYYYPSDAPEVARIPANRLISYRSEAEARKAGKQAPPTKQAAPTNIDRAAADTLFEQGRDVYAKAVNLPATAERNRLYDEAFQLLTQSVQVYHQLAANSPNDDSLGEAMRRASQLRYGAMKQRTAH